MFLKRGLSMYHTGIADHHIPGGYCIFPFSHNIPPIAAVNVQDFQYIRMLVQHMGVILAVVYIYKICLHQFWHGSYPLHYIGISYTSLR